MSNGFEMEGVAACLHTADEYNTKKPNIYVKQRPLAVNLILKRGLVFQTWLP